MANAQSSMPNADDAVRSTRRLLSIAARALRINWAFRIEHWALSIVVCVAACATAPPPKPPVITWEQKLGWIIRLEDQRILRDPNTPPPVVLVPARGDRPAIVAPPPPSDLIRLMRDPEARVRRRAALAAGRAGLGEAIEPLTKLLGDDDPEVRQMSAFALGLIGDGAARPPLQAALKDADPIVQGRAAEALGLLGDAGDAPLIGAMVQAHVSAGAVANTAADDLRYPLDKPIEAVRLGLYALVRLGSYEALAAAALNANGQPVSRWWPVAYALQQLGDPRGASALVALLGTEGRYTAAFAARGLGVMKARAGVDPLMRIVTERRAPPAVVMQAVRALAAIGDGRAADPMIAIIRDAKADPPLRLEAMTAIGALRPAGIVDLLLDMLSDSSPAMRGAAMQALARVDSETFLSALSGLDPDRDWGVRAAQAAALATLDAQHAQPRLMAMLQDRDQRVVPAVLNALVTLRAPRVEQVLLEHLRAEDFVLRATAANGLGELKVTSAVAALIEAYRLGQKDATYVARAAALGALSRIDANAARPLLEEALKDRDWAVRMRAFTLLKEAGAPPALGTFRPAPSEHPPAEREWNTIVAPRYSPLAYIDTDKGTIEIELAVVDAPLTIHNFIELARKGFFDGVSIHRVVADFVIQDGDPRGDGEGGPGYSVRDEINQRPYLRGTVGMALDWKDTGGSQFFITHSPQPHLDARYTVFGQVTSGIEVVDRIQPWDVIRRIRIWDGVTLTQ
jgi:HEAT repeat protein/cyclophilin family peptidyl-prolyl cis-trans isomerase